MADVAIKTSFSRLKAASVSPLIAPPVPKSPAVIPDNAPPLTELNTVGCNFRFLKIINTMLIARRKTEREISSNLLLQYLLKKEPKITNKTAGIPMLIMSFLSNPFLKQSNFGNIA